MRPQRPPRRLEAFLSAIAASTMLLLSCSSTPSKPLATSSQILAGRGEVTVRDDPNRNTTLKIEVEHLAPATKITEGSQVYVVWATPIGDPGRPQNLGALVVDQNLTGKLETVTPLRSFDLFITPEPSANVFNPTGERLLWSQVSDGNVASKSTS